MVRHNGKKMTLREKLKLHKEIERRNEERRKEFVGRKVDQKKDKQPNK